MHGAWCWERLIPHLESAPTTRAVLAVDLPGRGARAGGKALDAITLDDFAAAVAEDVEAADLSEVVLVGHSLGGITIPRAAARLGDRMRRLVYLAAAHPAPGACVADVMTHPLSPVSRRTPIEEMFCSDLDPETSAWLLDHLGDEAPGPMTEPIHRVPLEMPLAPVYVLCEHDRALHPEIQLEQSRHAGAEVVRFDSGHSPFASRPRELAELLLRLAG